MEELIVTDTQEHTCREPIKTFLKSPARQETLRKFLESVERRHMNVNIKPGHRRLAGVICVYCGQKKSGFVVMNYNKHSDMLMCRDCPTNWIPVHMAPGCCDVVGKIATISEIKMWITGFNLEGYI